MRKYLIIAAIIHSGFVSGAVAWQCEPTRPDMPGPFYKPDAPVRSRVDEGYKITGVVKSAKDCSPINDAMIELWQTGPGGQYDDDHRATVFSDKSGNYSFESNFPPGYYGRPPHIHIRVSAKEFKTLITQQYPNEGDTEAVFDLVLIPKR